MASIVHIDIPLLRYMTSFPKPHNFTTSLLNLLVCLGPEFWHGLTL